MISPLLVTMSPMKLSIIIPAYNEEKLITRCITSVFAALESTAELLGTEVIVANNNSTDATADLAQRAGAVVVHEPVQQIARTRNAGARAATGDWLLFIDADSILHPVTLGDMLRHIQSGRFAAGGSVVGMDEAPRSAHLSVGVWNIFSKTFKQAAGSFVFCRADAFGEIGGFDEALFAAEEIDLSNKLKKWAKSRGLSFVILRKKPHLSSGRKFYLYSKREMFALMWRTMILPSSTLRSKKYLDLFYDGRR